MACDTVPEADKGVSVSEGVMRRAKRHINGFINHLFWMYKVPRIPVRVTYGYQVVETPNGMGFGVYTENPDGTDARIYVGNGKLGKRVTMGCIAHEFVHYLQSLHGRQMIDGTEIEEDAEYWAQALLHQYIINKKSKTMRIDGVGDIWERKDIH